MKLCAVFLLAGTAVAFPSWLKTRQAGSSNEALLESWVQSVNAGNQQMISVFGEKPSKVKDIKGENHTLPGSKHSRYWFGAYDIPAGKVSPPASSLIVLGYI
jgi:hypothetical protein